MTASGAGHPDDPGEPAGRLERLLRDGVFCVTSEAVPPRSADPAPLARQAQALQGFADAVNVTDNPTARVHMSPVAGAAILARAGLEPVVQLTVRDRNRMSLSSDLLGAWAVGARGVLCLSGDPGGVGDHPDAKTAFDLTVVDLVRLAAGLRRDGRLLSGGVVESPPRFFVGVADSPLAPGYDYGRLEAKIDAGARFVQTQIVFDVEAFAAWAAGAQARGLIGRASLLAGVAVARSAASARYMRANLPGVVVPDELIERLEAAGPGAQDEGVRIGAELIRSIQGIPGISGVHVMALGHPETVGSVVAAAGLLPRPG
jgi:methylenetetrahydrofolate reductase (NADPH)